MYTYLDIIQDGDVVINCLANILETSQYKYNTPQGPDYYNRLVNI